MTGITDQGFVNKTFTEIKTDLLNTARLSENLGQDYPDSPTSVVGVFSNIIGAGLKELWDLAGATVDQANRETSSGKHLDDNVALIGLTRLLSTGATGSVSLINSSTTPIQIPEQTQVTKDGQVILLSRGVTVSRTQCYSTSFTTATVAANTTYTINAEGDIWSYTSSANPTSTSILEGLQELIGEQETYTASMIDGELVLSFISDNNRLTTTNSNNLTTTSIVCKITGETVLTGKDITVTAGEASLVTPITDVEVLISEDFADGADEETDAALRLRANSREQSTGTATLPAIRASISDLSGVTSVHIIQNNKMEEDSEGRPAKSYEVYVEGGVLEDLAEELWRTKPAAIEIVGDIPLTVVTETGEEEVVYISRNISKFAHVAVSYVLNPEEIPPVDIEGTIKNIITSSGNNMKSGEDLDPKRFYGNLYSNVNGVFFTEIKVAVTDNSTDIPSYTTNVIPVSAVTNLIFDDDRVVV